MRELAASEASRNFSALLDSAERGETVVITRAGRRIAQVMPVDVGNGGSLRAVHERWRGSEVDDRLAENIEAARSASNAAADADPWRE